MEISAKIIEIFETANITETFRKREFVVEYSENPSYPEYIKFELTQDKCDILNNFNIGDEVTISFNLKGRKWTDPQGTVKYFNSLQAWRLDEKNGDDSKEDSGAPVSEEPEWLNDKDEENELPF